LLSKADQVLKSEIVAADQLPLLTANRRSILGAFFVKAVFVDSVCGSGAFVSACALSDEWRVQKAQR
jgi:hypothetical protein